MTVRKNFPLLDLWHLDCAKSLFESSEVKYQKIVSS